VSSVKVRLKVFPPFSNSSYPGEVFLEVNEDITVLELLHVAAGKGLLKLDRVVKCSDGECSLGEGVVVLVNARNVEDLAGLKTKLSEGDRVAVMPVAGGG